MFYWIKCLCFVFIVALCRETFAPRNGEVVYSKPYQIINGYKRFPLGTRASFRCSKTFTLMDPRTTQTCITQPSGNYPHWSWYSRGPPSCVPKRSNRN